MSVLGRTLQRDTPIPLYYQLKEIILNEITSGRLLPGDYLPTENELMESYRISRATVRQAMSELVNENYLSRQKGKGTFVSKPKISEQYVNRVETYMDQMKKAGSIPVTKVVCCNVVQPNMHICSALNITQHEEVIHLIRIRLIEEEPIVVAETYMPYLLCKEVLQHDMAKESLYHILEMKEATQIVKAKRTLEAVSAGEQNAKMLHIQKEDALQIIKTTAFNKEGTIIEYTIAKYRGDRNLFVVETEINV